MRFVTHFMNQHVAGRAKAGFGLGQEYLAALDTCLTRLDRVMMASAHLQDSLVERRDIIMPAFCKLL